MRRIVGLLAVSSGVIAAIPWIAIFVGIAESSTSGDTYFLHWTTLLTALIPTVIGLALGLVWYGLWATALREWEDRLDRERTDELRAERDDALPQTEGELSRLLSANRALLDEYQKPVRARARTSYIFAQIAIAVGLVVLIVGAAITLAVNDSSAQLGVASLTAVGAALSGYIARTFLRVYERAQDQLNFYFREPLITSYLLTAERLAEKLDGEKRDQAYADMVGEIVRAFGADLSPTAAAFDRTGVTT